MILFQNIGKKTYLCKVLRTSLDTMDAIDTIETIMKKILGNF